MSGAWPTLGIIAGLLVIAFVPWRAVGRAWDRMTDAAKKRAHEEDR